jgi:hypothetical protein
MIVTREGVTLRLTGEEFFEAEARVPQQGEFSMRIVTEADSAFSFMDGFGITDLCEIGQISYDDLRVRYLHGEAIFYVRVPDLGVEIGFQLVQSRTIVFQREHHFYDAVEKHLRGPEDLAKYINDAQDLLSWYFHGAGGVFGATLPLLN